MADPFNFNVLYKPNGNPPPPALDPLSLDLTEQAPAPTMEDGAKITELNDGSALIDLNPQPERLTQSGKFNANLADEIDEVELSRIASELIQGIENDNQSRQEWLETHAEGIKLLGLVVENSQSNPGNSSAPLEGMSTVRHPLLLDAVQVFQANARGELLPAAGPVKIRDDETQKPSPMMGHNGGPPMTPPPAPMGPPPMGNQGMPPMPMGGPAGPMQVPPPNMTGAPPGPMPGQNGMAMPFMPPMMPPEQSRSSLASALERDMNHYLTTTATEYYPDTDRMLFNTGFGGTGIKKVYNCPIRRRPVSESIPIEDFIVSNALTDLANASRKTHQIKMRPSTMKRMQLLGVYRDVTLSVPTQADQPTSVDQAKAAVMGVQPQTVDPKDSDYIVYECYCELNIKGFEHKDKKGKVTGLQLPYRVTIEKTSQKILEVRRNWRESDPLCLAREYFVEFPYNKAFGFYGIGLLHILGNTTKTLTSAWRELIDSGMFANFPGFIYAKGAGRQLTNQFRVPPGGGVGLDVGLQRLQDAVMPLPYKDLGPAFTAFIQHVEELGQRVGSTANIAVGEGKQDAPVGTTLALIEQATKPTGAVLKRLHAAQSKEFQLLKERFREDPEAFWRFNRKPAMPWQKEQFVKALNDFDMVPVSDPNNPTALHRAAKSQIIAQAVAGLPGLLDPKKAWIRIAEASDIDNPEDLLAPPPPPGGQPQPNPDKVLDAKAKLEATQARAAGEMSKSQARLAEQKMEMEDHAADRASRERIAAMELETERVRLATQVAQSAEGANAAKESLTWKIASDHIKHQDKMEAELAKESRQAEREEAREQREAERERERAEREAKQAREP